MSSLSSAQIQQYKDDGYVAPLDVLSKEEALEILDNITLESSAYKEIFEYVYGMALALN